MKIVLDTNCLLVSVQEYSKYYWLWQAFQNKKFTLCYTSEILNEYFEILSQYYSFSLAKNVVDAILDASQAEPIRVYYKWQLIIVDPDDNKFVDCAVSANASYLVTNDRHFNILKETDFPKLNIVDIQTFKNILT
ncbi:MAG: putative toxin-antitoxin system toxin component, PIN family [Dysgonamonadaceae bacterium]|jgi:putative PIN family toxin of toxin-antitoxin system|nr:putative toxin-antitoxin system toxin component, PIN family [Dysgonamonadaceae bacterium]